MMLKYFLSLKVEESFKAGLALELWNPDVCLNVYNELQQIGLENVCGVVLLQNHKVTEKIMWISLFAVVVADFLPVGEFV